MSDIIPTTELEKYECTCLIGYGCLLLFTNMLFKCKNMEVVLGWSYLPTSVNLLYAEETPHFYVF